jgi:DNA-binding NtrC family response regulator
MTSDPARIQLEVTADLSSALIIDDEPIVRELFSDLAAESGLHVRTVSNTEEAFEILKQIHVDLIITDLRVPQIGGMELVKHIRADYLTIEIVVLTQYGTIETAVKAMRLGAIDFLTKPFSPQDFQKKVRYWKHALQTQHHQHSFGARGASLGRSSRLIGESGQIQKVRDLIAKVAQHQYPVLILGETGTGKELAARSIHLQGARAKKAFIPVDCASLAPTLIESELFGHKKGAFTGAAHEKKGLIEAAHGGTLFLDEIGEMSKELQAKFLRAIQEEEIRPIGSTTALPVDVRIIAATNLDLRKAIQGGHFREDLYYRLNVVELRLPPLRERTSDIPLLISAFVEKYSSEWRRIVGVSPKALEILSNRSWPGNVRELENTIERAIALGAGPRLEEEDFLPSVEDANCGEPAVHAGIQSLQALQKSTILTALREFGGNKIAAARRLGIGKTTLYQKLKEYSSKSF